MADTTKWECKVDPASKKATLTVARSDLQNGFFERMCGQERTGLMGAVRPQTPHRSPRQAFGGNFCKGASRRRREK